MGGEGGREGGREGHVVSTPDRPSSSLPLDLSLLPSASPASSSAAGSSAPTATPLPAVRPALRGRGEACCCIPERPRCVPSRAAPAAARPTYTNSYQQLAGDTPIQALWSLARPARPPPEPSDEVATDSSPASRWVSPATGVRVPVLMLLTCLTSLVSAWEGCENEEESRSVLISCVRPPSPPLDAHACSPSSSRTR